MMRHINDSDRTKNQKELLDKIILLMNEYVENHEQPVNRVMQVLIYENGKKSFTMYSGV